MIHPSTKIQYINDIVGYGIFATEIIPKGTITWVRDELDRELTPEAFNALHPTVREVALKYSYRNGKGNYILPWDHTRYTNHSFYANTMLTPYGFEIAIKDIKADEQITNDYGTLNIIESFEPYDEGHERKMVHPNDLMVYWQEYDKQILQAIKNIGKKEQPLWSLIPDKTQKTIGNIINGSENLLSILNCYYQCESIA